MCRAGRCAKANLSSIPTHPHDTQERGGARNPTKIIGRPQASSLPLFAVTTMTRCRANVVTVQLLDVCFMLFLLFLSAPFWVECSNGYVFDSVCNIIIIGSHRFCCCCCCCFFRHNGHDPMPSQCSYCTASRCLLHVVSPFS